MRAKPRKNRELKASKNFRNGILKSMFNNTKTGELCDVIFVVDGRDFFAHKAVLADVSPMIKAMLTGGMKESQSGRDDGTRQRIALEEISYGVFKDLLRFVYVGSISLSQKEALLLLKAADMYQIEELVSALDDFIASGIDAQNCVEMWDLTTTFVLPKLEKALRSYSVKDFSALSSEYTKLPYDAFYTMFRDDELQKCNHISVVVDALVEWLEKDGHEERRKRCDALLKCIRWNWDDTDELALMATKLIPLTKCSSEARDITSRILQRSADLSVGQVKLLDDVMLESGLKVGANEKAMAFSERVYGFKRSPGFVGTWRQFRDDPFQIRLEGEFVEHEEAEEDGTSSTTDLNIHLKFKKSEGKDGDGIDSESRIRCYCFFLDRERRPILIDYGWHEGGYFDAGVLKQFDEGKTPSFDVYAMKVTETSLSDPEQKFYDAATDSVEIGILVKYQC